MPRSRRCSVCGEPGHTARTCQAIGSSGITTRATKAPDKDAVGAIAPMIVGTANFCVVTTFGAECGLTDLEGKLLIPSVQRTLARMPAAAAQKAAIVIDPLVILTVIIMWGRRIASIKDMEARAKYQINPTEQARANGVTGFTHSVESTEQQTTPPTVVNFDAARQRQAAEQLMPTPERVVANGAASNGTYGAPSHIRESIGSDAEF